MRESALLIEEVLSLSLGQNERQNERQTPRERDRTSSIRDSHSERDRVRVEGASDTGGVLSLRTNSVSLSLKLLLYQKRLPHRIRGHVCVCVCVCVCI